jgi:hypothetical protein
MNKLTVQDLAMFLGCTIVRDKYTKGVLDTSTLEYIEEFNIAHEVKPILRPLSDMTAEEEKYFESFVVDSEAITMNDNLKDMAVITKMLIEKRFDVFGWVEKGLAIDSTKVKE